MFAYANMGMSRTTINGRVPGPVRAASNLVEMPRGKQGMQRVWCMPLLERFRGYKEH